MGTLFALVLTMGMTDGSFEEMVLGVYESQQQCEDAATEQRINGECYPVERIVRGGEVPAETAASH
ncbi:DUF1482 family protein [Franconibacter pulveris 1160]|uniref:DUF1482 family protein n=1 Tax=Franconibacter pulveris TaxID=435910 RepID=UPI000467B1C5|nr:DUF1482 family protein [Franconibacter pulveris]